MREHQDRTTSVKTDLGLIEPDDLAHGMTLTYMLADVRNEEAAEAA